jgi:vacuolar-type H+-ATPase subunit E/Vma4
MEEIVGAEALRAEILDDARKKAGRLIEEAEEECSRTLAAAAARAGAAVADISSRSESGSRRFRRETMARFPLERTRMRTEFADRRLREAMEALFSSLDEERVASLAESLLARGASFLSGRSVFLSRKGLSEEAARAIAGRCLADASSLEIREDESLPAPGLLARAGDGGLLLRATLDLVEERLLDESRGELVRALCSAAFDMDAGAPGEALDLGGAEPRGRAAP